MSRIMRKPVFGVADQVQHKLGCTTTEDGQRLEISDLGRIRVTVLYYLIYVEQIRALISCVVTGQVICTFALFIQKAGFLITLLP